MSTAVSLAIKVVSIVCHFCSRPRPAWRIHQITRAQSICDYCLEWHKAALEFLAGRSMPGCQVCGETWEFLRDSTLGVEVRMYVVPKDGNYQILCAGRMCRSEWTSMVEPGSGPKR